MKKHFRKKGDTWNQGIGVIIVTMIFILVIFVVPGSIRDGARAAVSPIFGAMGQDTRSQGEIIEREREVIDEQQQAAIDLAETVHKQLTECLTTNANDQYCECSTDGITLSQLVAQSIEIDFQNRKVELRDEQSTQVRDSIFSIPPSFQMGHHDSFSRVTSENMAQSITRTIKSQQVDRVQITLAKTILHGLQDEIEIESDTLFFSKPSFDTILVREDKLWDRTCGGDILCRKEYVISGDSQFDVCGLTTAEECSEGNSLDGEVVIGCGPLVESFTGCSESFTFESEELNIDELSKTEQGRKVIIDYRRAIINPENINEIVELVEEIKDESVDVRIHFTDSFQPYDALTDGVSTFSSRAFGGLKDTSYWLGHEDMILVMVSVQDQRVDLLMGGDAQDSIKTTSCQNLLSDNFKIKNNYKDSIVELLKGIKTAVEDTSRMLPEVEGESA